MQRRSKALQIVLEEGQKAAQQLPLKRRALLYRGLAEVCGDSQKAVELRALAKQCDALRRMEKTSQFNLSLDGDTE